MTRESAIEPCRCCRQAPAIMFGKYQGPKGSAKIPLCAHCAHRIALHFKSMPEPDP